LKRAISAGSSFHHERFAGSGLLKQTTFKRSESVVTRLLARFSVCAACVASAGTIYAAPTQTKSPAPTVKDLTKQIEVVTSGRLRVRDDGYAEVSVTLWNNAERDVEGPIFVVVDGSGLDQVTIANSPELTDKGKGVFQIIGEDQRLVSHGMTPVVPLVFKAPQDLTQPKANSFALATRVFGREGQLSPAAAAADEDANFETRGKSYDQARFEQVKAIQEKHTPELVKKPGVLSTALAENAAGDLVIRINTETRGQAKSLPAEIEGVPVQVQAIPGGIKNRLSFDGNLLQDGVWKSKETRQKERAAAIESDTQAVTPTDPQVRFDRPVPIGVSGINAVEICASGTIGSRVIDTNGKLYALSNTHVFARMGDATRGEPIVQPSQGDNNCDADLLNNTVGTLADFVPYVWAAGDLVTPRNVMDCAIMEIINVTNAAGETVPSVGFATPPDGYGAPSRRILRKNRVGLLVQKFGRTTGYSRGFTTATNVMEPIDAFTDFVVFFRMDQYSALAPYNSLSEGGDSGSLIVTVDGNRPVSILFAGGGSVTDGNPIGPVLDRFNVRIDDGQNGNATTSGDPTPDGISGRQGVAIGNLGALDKGYLPPELGGRIKNPKQGLVPLPAGALAPPT
jgi:hypothetical protein